MPVHKYKKENEEWLRNKTVSLYRAGLTTRQASAALKALGHGRSHEWVRQVVQAQKLSTGH